MLSAGGVAVLVKRLQEGQGEVTGNDLQVILEWANDIILCHCILDRVMDGSIVVSVQNGEVYYQISPKTKAKREAVEDREDKRAAQKAVADWEAQLKDEGLME